MPKDVPELSIARRRRSADAARDSAWRDQQNTGGQHRGGAQAGESQTA